MCGGRARNYGVIRYSRWPRSRNARGGIFGVLHPVWGSAYGSAVVCPTDCTREESGRAGSAVRGTVRPCARASCPLRRFPCGGEGGGCGEVTRGAVRFSQRSLQSRRIRQACMALEIGDCQPNHPPELRRVVLVPQMAKLVDDRVPQHRLRGEDEVPVQVDHPVLSAASPEVSRIFDPQPRRIDAKNRRVFEDKRGRVGRDSRLHSASHR